MSSKGINQDMEITNVLRHVGRWFQAGKSIDIPALCRLIEARREQRPELCAALTNLIQAINDAIAHGDRAAALEHFRNAIELARKTSEGR